MPNENELYARWRNSDGAERAEVERSLFRAVRKHVQAVVWDKLPDSHPHFVDEVADDVIHGLDGFRRHSKFSTWVQAVTKLKIKMEQRRRTRYRRVVDEHVKVDELVEAEEEGSRSRHVTPIAREVHPDTRIALDQLGKELGPQEKRTLRAMREGKDEDEIAKEERISPEAADSRRQRVKRKLKKVRQARRPGATSGN